MSLNERKRRCQAFHRFIDNIANYSIDEIYLTINKNISLLQIKGHDGDEIITMMIKLWVKTERLMQRQSFKSILRPKLWWAMSCVCLTLYKGELSFVEEKESSLLLHAAITCACPSSFIKAIIERYPDSPHVEDNVEQTALSIAAKVQNKQEWSRDIISCLIALNPKAALKQNSKGEYPLHLALKSGKLWDFGVEEIFKAAPDVLRMKDPISGLYPWAIAAKEIGREREHMYDDIYTTAFDESEVEENILDTIRSFFVRILVRVLLKYVFLFHDEMSNEVIREERRQRNKSEAFRTAYMLLRNDPSNLI